MTRLYIAIGSADDCIKTKQGHVFNLDDDNDEDEDEDEEEEEEEEKEEDVNKDKRRLFHSQYNDIITMPAVCIQYNQHDVSVFLRCREFIYES